MPRMVGTVLLALVLVCLASGCAGESPPDGSPAAREPAAPLQLEEPRTIEGLITELREDKLSVRASDGRQFIFLIDESPVPRDFLESHFLARQPIRVTYVVRENWSVPLRIEDA